MAETSGAPETPRKKQTWQPPELTAAKLAELDAEHEDVLVLRGDDEMSPWVVVIKRPSRPQTIQYKTTSRKAEGNQAVLANEQLLRQIIVWPEQHHVDAMFARWSMLADGIALDSTFKRFIGVATEAGLKG